MSCKDQICISTKHILVKISTININPRSDVVSCHWLWFPWYTVDDKLAGTLELGKNSALVATIGTAAIGDGIAVSIGASTLGNGLVVSIGYFFVVLFKISGTQLVFW